MTKVNFLTNQEKLKGMLESTIRADMPAKCKPLERFQRRIPVAYGMETPGL